MIGFMGGMRLILAALVVMTLLAVSPPASAGTESPPTSAQAAGNGGGNNGNGNGGGNGNGNGNGGGNGNGHGTSTTTTTIHVESTTTTTQVETTTTTTDPPASAGGAEDDSASTTTTTAPTTTAPIGPGPAESESTTTTVAPSTTTTVVLVPVGPDPDPPASSTSTTTPPPAGGNGEAPPDGPAGGEPVNVEPRPAFLADFGAADLRAVASPAAPTSGRLGNLFDTWAWTDRGGNGLTGATIEMLASILRAIVSAGYGTAVASSVTATLIVLAVVSRHRTSDGAIPSAS